MMNLPRKHITCIGLSLFLLCMLVAPMAPAANWDPMPVSGDINLLVVLVEFADRPLSTTPQHWSDTFFDTTPGAKSLVNFYKDNSFNALTVLPVSHTQAGSPPGVITVTLPISHPNYGNGDTAQQEKDLVSSILDIAALDVDFPSYDTSGDGTFQPSELNVYFIMAGYEAACTTKTPNFYAHAFFGYGGVTVSGKTLQIWGREGELNGSDVALPLGTAAHELGHSMLGLTDLYDLSQTNYGLGAFSLMSYGCWGRTSTETHDGTTPVAMDAWSRQYVGWSSPRTVPSGQTVSFGPALGAYDASVKLQNSGVSTTQYFLVENRYSEGWDLGLEKNLGAGWGGGLLIQHIDISVGNPPSGGANWGGNDINDLSAVPHQGVVAEEASTVDGSILAKTTVGRLTHLFYNGNNAEFSETTTPNSKLYDGTPIMLAVGNISDRAQTMTATIYNTLPTCEITDPLESALLVGPTYTVTGTATDLSGTGLQKVEVSTDGGTTWAAAAGTTTWSYNWVLPADGAYSIKARATDNMPNTGAETAAVSITVDNTNPTSVITSPAQGSGLPAPGITVTGSATDNASSGIKHVEVTTDGGSNWSMAVDDSGDSSWSSWSYYWAFAADGTYTVKSRATDNSDVVEVTGPGVAVNVDITPPDGTISINSGSGYSNSQTVSVVLSATDSGSGVSQMQLSDDGVFDTEQWEDYASSRTWTFAGNGEKTLHVRFRDSLGNVSSAFSDDVMLVLSSHTPFNTVWLKQFGTTSFEEALAVAVDGTGNVYTAGYSQGDLAGTGNAGVHDLFVSKFDSDGTHQWTRQLGTTEFEKAYGIAVDANGNVYVAGYTGGSLDGNTSAGGYDIFIVKYDTSGTKQWSRQTGTSSSDYANAIVTDPTGNLFIAGQTYGSLHGNTNAGFNDAFLMKYNSAGARLWTKQIGSSSSDYAYGVSVGPDGSAFIAGVAGGALDGNQHYGFNDIFVVKYNSSGTKIWSTQYGSSGSETAKGVSVDSAGNIYVAGNTQGSLGDTNAGLNDIFVAKFDQSGTRLWTGQLGTANSDYAYATCTDTSGNVFVTGKSYGGLDGNSSAGGYDIVVIKYDAAGNRLWTKQLGGSFSEGAYGMAADGAGNILISGETSGSLDGANFGNDDAFLAKLGVDFAVPESTHYEWEAYLSGGDCAVCHATPASFVPAGFIKDDLGFCRSCHNHTAMAHDKNPFGARGHSIMASVTSAGLRTPSYGNITSGEYNNQPFSRLKDGDKVVCATCHNVMGKTEDYARVWEPTTTQDDQTYSLEKGGWDNYGYLKLKVYRDTSLWGGPSYVKDRKDYIVDPSEYTYDETAGTITFLEAQDPFEYIYATLEYPYLRANNSGNRLCFDCHTQQTHKGVNCLTCHIAHGTGNTSGIRDVIRTTDRSEKAVVFTAYSGVNSFADGDTAYDGICEVCHTTTKYHRRDGTGFANHSGGVDHSGKDCGSCHTHALGFAR